MASVNMHLMCSICNNAFDDPVTTTCGHSFCKSCLQSNCMDNDLVCPECKTQLTNIPGVNIILRDIIQQLKKTPKRDEDVYTGAPDEVACDSCTERKLKAQKSCLVCLASYCSTHLENHNSTPRLKGHKLVEPVKNMDARACLKHGRPLELYSRKQQTCVCVRCVNECQEKVVSAEDEWKKKKAKLDNTKTELQQKIREREFKVVQINTALKSCKDQLEKEWRDIEAVFSAVTAILEETKAKVLQPLKEKWKALEREAKDHNDGLEAEISKLEKTILDLDDLSALEDHIHFLQTYPSHQDLDNFKDWSEVELDTSPSFGMMRKTTSTMLERIEQELEKLTSTELRRVSQFTELRRVSEFTVDVKLDPATAHRRLVVSDDGKEVKDGGEDQEVADVPERFDMFLSVMGLQSLKRGKSYWEVDVYSKTGWDLGVARGDANRKGKIKINPDNGYWVIKLYEDDKFAALTEPPVRWCLKEKPTKVGVFVDYEEGLVSFYDVMSESHIFSFTECSFRDKLYPYFSPHAKRDEINAEPLIISTEKH